jgi:hypothetical protein
LFHKRSRYLDGALFPLMNPATCATEYFGGIAINTGT